MSPLPMPTDTATLRFGRFEISAAERVLRIDGKPAVLGARAFDLLLALAERRDRLVSQQELLDLVWPGVVVEPHNITAQISSLRKLLGANVIATIPGRGYRFTALPDEPVDVAAPAAPPLAQTPAVHRLVPLIGRDEDVAALAGLLQRNRLVTVLGAGGIGKSLLARHVQVRIGEQFAHGSCWIELASVSDASELPARIAEAVGVRPGAGEPLAGLCASMASLTMLITLDNAEHLLSDVARTVAALLDAAPGLHLLVTSQAALRLAAEHVYRVGPRAVPEGPLPPALAQAFSAVARFGERSRAADSRFELNDVNAMAAIEVCRQLDGLPLAIELAAARAPLLGMRPLAASMQNRLRLLTHNRDASAPARQQTLRAALEWSHAFLDDSERKVFRRLGVISDSASLALIQQVAADESEGLDAWAVLDALGTLVDRSLVTVLQGDDEEPRYRLLESPRLLALEHLDAAGERALLQQRHAGAIAAAFDKAWDELWSGRTSQRRWAAAVLLDASNARDALAWARAADEPSLAAAIAATLYLALPRWTHVERMALAASCESLVERLEPARLRVRAGFVAVRPMWHPSQQASLAIAERTLMLARELDRDAPDRWLLYLALSEWTCAAALIMQPPLDALRAAVAELDALEDPAWPPQRLQRGWGARRLARVCFVDATQPAEQLAITRRWMATLDAAGQDTMPVMGTLIDAELECGHVQAAIELGERALAQLAGTRDEWSLMMVQVNLAMSLLAMDDTRRARPLLQAAWPVGLRFGTHVLSSDYPALLAALEGRPRVAARLAGYADAAYGARGLVRHPNEAAARGRSGELARAALGEVQCAALIEEGRDLRDEQIAALAFACADGG